ncbi:MAG: hypothetical protein NWR72_21260 [Bacteroidia bacterium]|nr:hypothetical protein [Bacteroidia bacterium]
MIVEKHVVESYLFDALREELEEEGFEQILELGQWRKNIRAGFHSIIVSISPYPDVCVVEFHLGVRITDIEQLTHAAMHNPIDYQANSHTLMISHGRLMNKAHHRFQVAGIDHLDDLANDFRDFWAEVGRSFFTGHETLSAVAHTLNRQPLSACAALHNQAHRCIKGIAAAWLTRAKNYEALVQIYDTQLANLPNGIKHRPRFQQLAALLGDISPN